MKLSARPRSYTAGGTSRIKLRGKTSNKLKKIGFIGLATAAISAIYIVVFFLFAPNDSGLHNRVMTMRICQLYGLAMLFMGSAMAYYSIGKEVLSQTMRDITYTATKENLLDDMHEVEEKPPIDRKNISINWVLNAIHLFIAFFLATGDFLGVEEAIIVVGGFVYAMFWALMGGVVFMPLYKGLEL